MINGVSCRQVERYSKELAGCIATARAMDEAEWPSFPRTVRAVRDPQAERILTKLKQWRLVKAAELELDPGALINNAFLEAISKIQPRDLQELQAINGLRQWQIDEMGSEMIALVS